MATLAPGGRITEEVAKEEIDRLKAQWRTGGSVSRDSALLISVLEAEKAADLDSFDSVQLAHVIRTCRESENMSQAGRKLFAVSRKNKKTANDSDRLRKYLAKFGVTWDMVN